MDIQKEAEQLANQIWMIDGNFSLDDPKYQGMTYKEVWFKEIAPKILQSFERICREQRDICSEKNPGDIVRIENEIAEVYLKQSRIKTTPLLTDNK